MVVSTQVQRTRLSLCPDLGHHRQFGSHHPTRIQGNPWCGRHNRRRVIWYQIYGRSRAIKENAFRESVRQQGMARILQLTEEALNDESRRVAVVAGTEGQDAKLLRLGRPMADSDPQAEMVRFLQPGDSLEEKINEYDPDLLIGSASADDLHEADHFPRDRDAVLLTGEDIGEIRTIAVLGSGGPYDVLKICMATKLAEEEGASIRLIHVLDPSTSRAQIRSLEKFHEELAELVGVPTESRVVESEDLLAALTTEVDDVDLVIVGAPIGRHFFTDLIDRIVRRVEAPLLLVRVADRQERATLRSTFDRLVTSRLSRGDAEHAE